MATLVISPLYEYGNFKSSGSPTHKGHSLQGRKSPVNNSNLRRNSTSSHSPKAVSPPHRLQQEPITPPAQRSSSGESRKLERALSEPSDRRSSSSTSSSSSVQSNTSRYKTELCRPFEENGTCKYGDKCQFAHGVKDLRALPRHPKYKTELCRSFHTTGLCQYGPRCHFIHNNDKTKSTLFSALTSITPNNNNNSLPPSRLKALSSSSLGSAGDLSPPSSHSGSPTIMKTSEDLFQFPSSPTAFPFPPEFPASPPISMQRNNFLDYTTHEFNPDFYDTPSIFQERMLSSVFGSPVTTATPSSDLTLDLDPSGLCGSPTMDLFPPTTPVTPAPSAMDTSFVAFPVFNFFGGKHEQ